MITKPCSWCNKSRDYEPNRIKKNKTGHFFCDRSCHQKWRKIYNKDKNAPINKIENWQLFNCSTCSKVLMRFKPQHKFIFCSEACHHVWLTGPINSLISRVGGNETIALKFYEQLILKEFKSLIKQKNKGEMTNENTRTRYLNRRAIAPGTLEHLSKY